MIFSSRLPMLISAAVIATLSVAADARAQAVEYDHVAAREALQRREILPLSRILASVQGAAAGEVVMVRLTRHEEHGWRYRIRVLAPDGRLRLIRIDARTGRVIDITDE